MEFKEFNKQVKKYYPLNEDKTIYLILFNNWIKAFYKYKDSSLIKLEGGFY